MQITVDIDGWLTNECDDFKYGERTPRHDRIYFLKRIAKLGIDIIIETRRMSCDAKVTYLWLKKYDVPYTLVKFLGPNGTKSPQIFDDSNTIKCYTRFGQVDVPIDFASNSLINFITNCMVEAGFSKQTFEEIEIADCNFRLSDEMKQFVYSLLTDKKVYKTIQAASSAKCSEQVELELSWDDPFTPNRINKGVEFTSNFMGGKLAEKVVLYSGGMDSMMCYLKNKEFDPLCLFIGYNEKYNELEYNRVYRQCMVSAKNIMRIDIWLPARHDSWQYVIPARNFLFLAIAALFSDNIVFGMMHGDRSTDKTPEFVVQAEKLLREYYGRNIRIEVPFQDETKHQALSEFSDDDIEKIIFQHFSCYEVENAAHKACGKCKACVRNAFAIANTVGIERYKRYSRNIYQQEPLDSDIAIEMFDNIENGMYVDDRRVEIIKVMGEWNAAKRNV